MLLSSYLDAKTIYFESQPKSRKEIYEDMVSRISRHYHLPISGSQLVDMILARDAQSSTAYATGIAMPHVRMDGFDDTLVSICFLDHPIAYEEIQVSVIVLIITEKTASKLYLNIVSALLKLSRDQAAMQQLRSQREGQSLIQILKSFGISIKENLTIADIMDANPVSVRLNNTLRELAGVMNEHNQAYLPVVDSGNRFLGEVDILCLLKVGVPDYLMMLDNLNFLSSYEPLENLFEKEDQLTVQDIMRKDHRTLRPGGSIIEAAHEMIQHNRRFFSIVEDGRLVGVVSAMDIFRKVVRA